MEVLETPGWLEKARMFCCYFRDEKGMEIRQNTHNCKTNTWPELKWTDLNCGDCGRGGVHRLLYKAIAEKQILF